MHFVFTLSSACGLLCCRATRLVKPVIFSFNALRNLYVINPTATGTTFRAQSHINYCKRYSNLLKTIMRDCAAVSDRNAFLLAFIAFVAINLCLYVGRYVGERGKNTHNFLQVFRKISFNALFDSVGINSHRHIFRILIQ